jgi:hypothetical protein
MEFATIDLDKPAFSQTAAGRDTTGIFARMPCIRLAFALHCLDMPKNLDILKISSLV